MPLLIPIPSVTDEGAVRPIVSRVALPVEVTIPEGAPGEGPGRSVDALALEVDLHHGRNVDVGNLGVGCWCEEHDRRERQDSDDACPDSTAHNR